jgi:hypothetical protein
MAANQPARPAIELPQKKERKKKNPTQQLPHITKFTNSGERILLRTTTTTGRKKLTTPRSFFLPDLFP